MDNSRKAPVSVQKKSTVTELRVAAAVVGVAPESKTQRARSPLGTVSRKCLPWKATSSNSHGKIRRIWPNRFLLCSVISSKSDSPLVFPQQKTKTCWRSSLRSSTFLSFGFPMVSFRLQFHQQRLSKSVYVRIFVAWEMTCIGLCFCLEMIVGCVSTFRWK